MRTRLLALASLPLLACGAVSPDAPQEGTLPNEPAPADARRCATRPVDLEVAADDLERYPPYAMSGCTLAYLARDASLMVRDLNSGAEIRLAGPDEAARRPTIDGGVVAWEAVVDARRVIKVHAAGKTTVIAGPFKSAGEPRVHDGSVVFTGWVGGPREETDIWLYDTKTGSLAPVLGGPGQRRFADVSGEFVVAVDASEDPDGAFDDDGRDVTALVVFERKTGKVTRRPSPGRQAFPVLIDVAGVAYLDWAPGSARGYEVKTGMLLEPASADRTVGAVTHRNSGPRPSSIGPTVEWVAEEADGTTSLYRAPAFGQKKAPIRAPGLEGLRLFAPISTRDFTVIAAVQGKGSARLKIAPR